MESLQLLQNKKEIYLFSIILLLIFSFNTIYEYMKYKDFTKEEVYTSEFEILNIYDKDDFYILKLQNSDITLFTSIEKLEKLEKLQKINIAVLTVNISFLDFLKGFYTKSIYYDGIKRVENLKSKLFDNINSQHKDIKLQELFNALFLAIPISKENRVVYTNFGISHLIAISGFHLGILSFVCYFILYYPYRFLHKKFFIFRNKRADVMFLTICILFFYLILTNLVPSLLRAFVMFVIAFYFSRSNIKIISFQTLLITFLTIISFFPEFLFSISFWFSIIGVFYIFLYLQYFKNLPKLFSFIFFNFWIFLVFNPIVHYIFYNTTYEQLISPFVTLLFTIFYPIELLLHFFGIGNLLDSFILKFINYEMVVFDKITPGYFFIIYVVVSLSSIFYKYSFYLLNLLLIGFNIYLFAL